MNSKQISEVLSHHYVHRKIDKKYIQISIEYRLFTVHAHSGDLYGALTIIK